MQLLHDACPSTQRRIFTQIRQSLRRVKANPAHADIVWCISRKPAILIRCRRTGLTGNVNAVELCHFSRAIFHGIGQHFVHIIRRCALAIKDLLCLLILIGENNIAVGIHNLNVALCLRILAVIRQCCVALRHLAHGNAISQTAQRHRCVVAIRVLQRRKSELFRHEIIRRVRRQFFQHLYRHRVGRLCYAVQNRCLTIVSPVFVLRPWRAIQLKYRHIRDNGIRCNQLGIHRRSIGAQRLNRGARLPCRLRCAIEHQTFRLFSAPADNT